MIYPAHILTLEDGTKKMQTVAEHAETVQGLRQDACNLLPCKRWGIWQDCCMIWVNTLPNTEPI